MYNETELKRILSLFDMTIDDLKKVYNKMSYESSHIIGSLIYELDREDLEIDFLSDLEDFHNAYGKIKNLPKQERKFAKEELQELMERVAYDHFCSKHSFN